MKRSDETSPHAVSSRDRAGTVATVALFSLSLAIVSVAVPILIVRAGYTLAEVGFFTALAAAAQIAIRFRLGALMRRVADKHLVGASAVLMAAGSAALALSPSTWVIVVSQLLQGAARGLFWTGVQTHAVRGPSTAARGLASVSLASGVGLIVGPGLAGVLLETSARLAMVAAAAAAVAALLPGLLMARLPVFPAAQDQSKGRVSRRSGVRAGSVAVAVAGAWRGLAGAYVPVALHQAAHSSTWIGIVVAVANAATIAAGWAARWVRSGSAAAVPLAVAVLGTGLGLAVFAAAAEALVPATLALVVSGLGMGLLQTLGPAAAAESVDEDERGDAMAAVGLYRAGATFLAPFGVASLVLVMPLGWALVSAGALLALPAGRVLQLRRR